MRIHTFIHTVQLYCVYMCIHTVQLFYIQIKKMRANIYVGKNWEEFKEVCRGKGTSASAQIQKWINGYLGQSETISEQAHPGWVRETINEGIRRSVPPSLEILQDNLKKWTTAQIEQLKEEITDFERLNKNIKISQQLQNRSQDINLNSQKELPEPLPKESKLSVSHSKNCDTLKGTEKKTNLLGDTPGSDFIDSSICTLKTQQDQPEKKSLSNREFSRLIERNSGSVSKWHKSFLKLPESHVVRQSGYVPAPRARWVLVEPKKNDQKI